MKRMFRHAAIFAAMCAALPGTAMAQVSDYKPPEAELAEAMFIMEAMFPVDTREQMMIDIVSAMGGQMATALMTGPVFEEPGIRAIMDQFMADLPETMRPLLAKYLPNMIKSTAIAYTREFTLEELQDISVFAVSPSGQRYFANVQRLLNDPVVISANQEFFAEVAVVQQQQGQLIRTRVEEYLTANPDAIERLQKAGVGRDE